MKKELLTIDVYAPHMLQKQFWKENFVVVVQTGVMETIVLGDFSATVCNAMDRSNNSKSLERLKLFKEFMELFQRVDILKVRNPHKQD